jgi:penicillin amidase
VPGQAGDPDSPHYRDLFELWTRHQYFPLFFSRGKIESVTERRVALEPANLAAPDRGR